MATASTPSQAEISASPPGESAPTGRGGLSAPMLRAARGRQAAFSEHVAAVFEGLGIHGGPAPALELRARMIAAGRDSNQSDFSQGIVAAREE